MEKDCIVDIKLSADVYILNNLKDRRNLIETTNLYSITSPPIITYNFESPIIEEAKQLPQYENLPIPVVNVFLHYGLNYIVSIIVRSYNLYLYMNS